MKDIDFTGIAVIAAAGVVVYSLYKAKTLASDALDSLGESLDGAQLETSDGIAELTGLADYERALMNAKTPEEVQALRQAWENRPWYRRLL